MSQTAHDTMDSSIYDLTAAHHPACNVLNLCYTQGLCCKLQLCGRIAATGYGSHNAGAALRAYGAHDPRLAAGSDQ
jgi:hypothetical protein